MSKIDFSVAMKYRGHGGGLQDGGIGDFSKQGGVTGGVTGRRDLKFRRDAGYFHSYDGKRDLQFIWRDNGIYLHSDFNGWMRRFEDIFDPRVLLV